MKNPFSIFDFLGYVFPGAFSLLSVFYFAIINPVEFCNPQSLNELLVYVGDYITGSESVVSCTIFLILSYIAGHLIAYLSSITVEKFVIWWFGYPSEFLLKSDDKRWHFFHDGITMIKEKNYHFVREIIRTYTLRIIVSLLMFPVFLPTLLVKCLGYDNFFVKNLDPYLKDIILQKKNALLKVLKLPDSSHYDKVDYHRVIYHYEYEHSSSHRTKMDNYVALYDFLRSITLIFSGIFMFILGVGIFGASQIGLYFWIDLAVLLFITYLSFMSFFKFYRRFTLEAFMCLVSDKDL